MSKGFRQVLLPSLDTWNSPQYEWTQLRKEKSEAIFDALVNVPPSIREFFKNYYGPKEFRFFALEGREVPWKFSNLAYLRLGDLFGTENLEEALSHYLAWTSKGLGQRLCYKDLFKKLWGSQEEEEFLSYIFRRKKGPAKKLKYDLHDYPMELRLSDPEEAKEAGKTVDAIAYMRWVESFLANKASKQKVEPFPVRFFDARMLALGQRLFGKGFCHFMAKHKLDFLDVQRDPQLWNWRGNFLNDDDDRFILLVAYLYNKNIHAHLGWKNEWLACTEEPFEEAYPRYYHHFKRNLHSFQPAVDYFAWLDDVLFANNLPNWVLHKDPIELFGAYEGFQESKFLEKFHIWDRQENLPDGPYWLVDPLESNTNLLEALFYWVCGLGAYAYGVFLMAAFAGLDSSDELSLNMATMELEFDFLYMLPYFTDWVDAFSAENFRGTDELYAVNPPDFWEEEFTDLFEPVDFSMQFLYSWSSYDQSASNFYMQTLDSKSVLRAYKRSVFCPFAPSWGVYSGCSSYRWMSGIFLAYFFFYFLREFFDYRTAVWQSKLSFFFDRPLVKVSSLRSLAPEIILPLARVERKSSFLVCGESITFLYRWLSKWVASRPKRIVPIPVISLTPRTVSARHFARLKNYYILKSLLRKRIVLVGSSALEVDRGLLKRLQEQGSTKNLKFFRCFFKAAKPKGKGKSF